MKAPERSGAFPFSGTACPLPLSAGAAEADITNDPHIRVAEAELIASTNTETAIAEWTRRAQHLSAMKSGPAQANLLALAEAHTRETEAWIIYLHAQGLDTRAISLLNAVTPQEQQAAA